MVQTSISAWLTKPQSSKQHDIQIQNDAVSTFLQNQSTNIAPPAAMVTTTKVETVQSTEPFYEAKQITKTVPTKSPKPFILKALPLPPNATLSPITSENVDEYRRMNALLLVIPYPKKFYEEAVNDSIASNISLVALWSQPSNDNQHSSSKQKVVSGIRCRLLARPPTLSEGKKSTEVPDDAPTLYIAALTTLAPYRGHGLASALFRRVTARAIREYGIVTVTAHMWEANEEARGWYARHGFREVGFAHDYYRRLKPSGAFLLERRIGPQDLLLNGVEIEENHISRDVMAEDRNG